MVSKLGVRFFNQLKKVEKVGKLYKTGWQSRIHKCSFDRISKMISADFYLNKGEPSSKPKYSLMTNSAQVLRRKGEKKIKWKDFKIGCPRTCSDEFAPRYLLHNERASFIGLANLSR